MTRLASSTKKSLPRGFKISNLTLNRKLICINIEPLGSTHFYAIVASLIPTSRATNADSNEEGVIPVDHGNLNAWVLTYRLNVSANGLPQ